MLDTHQIPQEEGLTFSQELAIEQPERLSLEAQEKALIKKCLQKNNGNRKHAAEDLGISERTLYRKIKQYEMEEVNWK